MIWWHWALVWAVVACVAAPFIGKFIKVGRGPWVLVLLLLPASVQAQEAKPSPWWATSLAVAGPLADGISTVYALKQSGPNARVMEGNAIYARLFGADVKAGEILAFKVGQAALFGAVVHYAGKKERKAAIGVAILTAGINFTVSAMNYRNAQMARRLNR